MRFAEGIEAALTRIAEAPDRWPSYRYGTRRVRLTRFPYLVVYRVPYLVVYRDEPTRILVVAIAHAKQRPGYWRKR
ncbi:type II toxin-antitoxin system RelE/ParE family toxin [Sorangium sp. So ce1151]|uniref:type II toxin-antitoxin system RelE/ParE family toxin n=1 Tax=Sorangium sp. So ce1151 TaxID=3133332 RepID=UPI003F5E265A